MNMWRAKQLAQHLTEWLPEFALKFSEWEGLGSHNAIPLIRKAARAVYTSDKYQRRGELGELLLHALIRQVFDSMPAISKYFYKDANNDTVKGFDGVHVVAAADGLELWLGESKLYKDVRSAIKEALNDLAAHTKRDYLKNEFIAIGNKIDDGWDHANALREMIDSNRSLDNIVKRICIPVLVSYESAVIPKHDRISSEFEEQFRNEIEENWKTFSSGPLPTEFRVHLFLFPMKSKAELLDFFDAELKRWQ
jgi:hypothetical protein